VVSLSICRSVTVVSPVKTAEPIEIPFGLRAGPRNHHVLDRGPDPPWKGAIVRERDGLLLPFRGLTYCSHFMRYHLLLTLLFNKTV